MAKLLIILVLVLLLIGGYFLFRGSPELKADPVQQGIQDSVDDLKDGLRNPPKSSFPKPPPGGWDGK